MDAGFAADFLGVIFKDVLLTAGSDPTPKPRTDNGLPDVIYHKVALPTAARKSRHRKNFTPNPREALRGGWAKGVSVWVFKSYSFSTLGALMLYEY